MDEWKLKNIYNCVIKTTIIVPIKIMCCVFYRKKKWNLILFRNEVKFSRILKKLPEKDY